MNYSHEQYRRAFLQFYDDAVEILRELNFAHQAQDDLDSCRLCPFVSVCDFVINAGKYQRMSDDEHPKFNCREEIFKWYLEDSK